MQDFIDTLTGEKWSFEDDVKVIVDLVGVYSFKTFYGAALIVPTTLQPSEVPHPTE